MRLSLLLLLCLAGRSEITRPDAASAAAPLTLVAGEALALSLDPASLRYSVSLLEAAGADAVPWFDSGGHGGFGGYRFSADGVTFSLADGSLVALGAPTRSTGADRTGAFTALSVDFGRRRHDGNADGSGGSVGALTKEWSVTFKGYANRTALSFVQTWHVPLNGSSASAPVPVVATAPPTAEPDEQQRQCQNATKAGDGFATTASPIMPPMATPNATACAAACCANPSCSGYTFDPEQDDASGEPQCRECQPNLIPTHTHALKALSSACHCIHSHRLV